MFSPRDIGSNEQIRIFYLIALVLSNLWMVGELDSSFLRKGIEVIVIAFVIWKSAGMWAPSEDLEEARGFQKQVLGLCGLAVLMNLSDLREGHPYVVSAMLGSLGLYLFASIEEKFEKYFSVVEWTVPFIEWFALIELNLLCYRGLRNFFVEVHSAKSIYAEFLRLLTGQ